MVLTLTAIDIDLKQRRTTGQYVTLRLIHLNNREGIKSLKENAQALQVKRLEHFPARQRFNTTANHHPISFTSATSPNDATGQQH